MYEQFKNIYTVGSRYLEHAYLEHRAISNKTLGPFSTNSSGVTTRYLELPAISNFLPGPLSVRDSGSRLYCYLANATFNIIQLKVISRGIVLLFKRSSTASYTQYCRSQDFER